MINKLDLIIIFFILNFLSISYCFKSELVHLVKSEYLLVNEDGIFHFKNNFDNEIEKIDSIKILCHNPRLNNSINYALR